MQGHRRYSRAPITEAVIDIHVSYEGQRRLQSLQAIAERFPDYVRTRTIQFATGEITVGQQVGASAKSEPVGFVFSNEDEHYVLQARLNGFALSRVAPYDTWNGFRNEASRLFDGYRDIASPDAVTRLAVRYINRFNLPGERVEISDYFETRPELPNTMPAMSGFYLQVTAEQPDIEATAIINQARVPSDAPNVISVILDIDVFREVHLPGDNEIWSVLDELREREYELFEVSITDRTRELIT